MFDRLGSLLSDYLDNEDTEQDIFSNNESQKKQADKNSSEDFAKDSFKTEKSKTQTTENKEEYTRRTFKFDTGKQQKEKFTTNNNQNFIKKSVVYSQQLIEDFTTLCVPVGSSLEKCKSSYKNLLRKYHPDKHTDNLKDQKDATEITAKINTAFNNIKGWYLTKK